jgi:hypothetical protein
MVCRHCAPFRFRVRDKYKNFQHIENHFRAGWVVGKSLMSQPIAVQNLAGCLRAEYSSSVAINGVKHACDNVLNGCP